MHLAPASLDPQLVKGDILECYEGLIDSMDKSHALVKQSFHHTLQESEHLNIHALQPGDFVYWKRHLNKDSLQPRCKGPYQVLLPNARAAGGRLLDTRVTPEEDTKP